MSAVSLALLLPVDIKPQTWPQNPITIIKIMSKPIMTSVKESLGFEKVSSLEELFIEQLQDLYSAETQTDSSAPPDGRSRHLS